MKNKSEKFFKGLKKDFKELISIITMNSVNRLFLYVDPSSDLYGMYCSQAEQHNAQGATPNAGFDLFVPSETAFEPYKSQKVDFGVTCAMYRANQSISFYMFTRSSMSKTNFRLSNSVGIIDSGYRGTIGAYFDAYPWQNDTYTMMKGSRVVQLCTPTLEPFMVTIVDSIDSLGQTERGSGGFGSTGV